MASGAARGDGTEGSRVIREAALRGVCDHAREVFRAAVSACEQVSSEWARYKSGGVGRGKKRAEPMRVVKLTKEFMGDVGVVNMVFEHGL